MSSCCSGRPHAHGGISDHRFGMTAVSAPLLARALLGRTPAGLWSYLIQEPKNQCGNPRWPDTLNA